ncbi:hypothetical protein CapIbe_000909 [Capra ibex]
MDIFPAGCVIAELFTEGVPLFDLSQLLAYRNGQFFPEQVLSKIEDRSIRELVTQMIHREPDKRLEAEDYLNNDSVPRVRAEALRTLTKVLALVKEVPRNDVNIYPEYILPGIAHLAQDDATIVRLAYAENIALLAETALRFLELVQLKNLNMKNDPNSEEIDEVTLPSGNYDTELQALHEMVQQKVVTLLSDPENIVKQTLMENGITQLCVFFGRQKANDVLLSHMITFLNDQNDWHLRGAFFDSIVGVAAYVGWQIS